MTASKPEAQPVRWTVRHVSGICLLIVWGLGIAQCAHSAEITVTGCPKPRVHKTHHKPSALLCQCQADYPQSPLVAAPEAPIPDPIEIRVYTYYYQILSNLTGDEDAPMIWEDYDPIYFVSGGYVPLRRVSAPEIDPSCGLSMVLLLCGTLVVIRGYRK